MKQKMDQKAIKAAAIELEKMINKYINDYPDVLSALRTLGFSAKN